MVLLPTREGSKKRQQKGLKLCTEQSLSPFFFLAAVQGIGKADQFVQRYTVAQNSQ